MLRRPACAFSYLYGNQLSGTIPTSLSSLTALTDLCVRRAEGRHCTTLRRLACALSWLHNNQFNGTVPSSMGNMNVLRQLCVRRAEGRHCSHGA